MRTTCRMGPIEQVVLYYQTARGPSSSSHRDKGKKLGTERGTVARPAKNIAHTSTSRNDMRTIRLRPPYLYLNLITQRRKKSAQAGGSGGERSKRTEHRL